MNGMPTVAVHDLVIHPRDNDLIAGTHGRGLYVLDDITPLQQLTPEVVASAAHVFTQRTATWWVDRSRAGQFGDNTYAGRNPPSVRAPGAAMDRAKIVNTPVITWYLAASSDSPVTLSIRSVDGSQSRTLEVPAKAGITRFERDGRFDPPAGYTPPPRRRANRPSWPRFAARRGRWQDRACTRWSSRPRRARSKVSCESGKTRW